MLFILQVFVRNTRSEGAGFGAAPAGMIANTFFGFYVSSL